MTYLTTLQLAERLGVTPVRVHQIAKARQIRPAIPASRDHLWSIDQLPDFARRPTGRPPGRPPTAQTTPPPAR